MKIVCQDAGLRAWSAQLDTGSSQWAESGFVLYSRSGQYYNSWEVFCPVSSRARSDYLREMERLYTPSFKHAVRVGMSLIDKIFVPSPDGYADLNLVVQLNVPKWGLRDLGIGLASVRITSS